jgi:tetratricopeptide (TPR) repeat protein
VPTWFNEGLAEYYSTFTMTDDQKVVLGKPIANHVYLLREKNLLPLKTLFSVNQDSPYYNERDKQSIFYAESWALMHFLILGNSGQRLLQLNKFLQLTEQNVPMDEAFTTAFQTTYAKMEDELRKYISHDRYPISPGHFQHKLDYAKDMETGALSDAEVQAYLGDLLLHSYRAEAESYLQKALWLEPKLAIANASLGMLRVREGKIDEARRSLEKAVAANSENYLIHYYYAYALSREGMTDRQVVMGYQPETVVRIRSELKKAIDLRPDYPESYNLLAFVNLVTESQLDETIALLTKVLTTSPGRNDLLFMVAQLYMRKHDFKTARQILERLGQNNIDNQLRAQAKSMLAQMNNWDEQLTSIETKRKEMEKEGSTRLVSSPDEPVIQPDPSKLLREALRKPDRGEQQVQGILVRIDCDSKGIFFVVKLEDRQVRLRTDKFESVSMVAFSPDAGSEITCGPRKTETMVVICYLPAADARTRIDGTIRSIEFVPKDFKLKG